MKVRGGFTLIALLIVIAVIGVLSAVISVVTNGSRANGKAAVIEPGVEASRMEQETQGSAEP